MNRNERQATLDGMRKVLPEIVRNLNRSGSAKIPLGGGAGLMLYLREGKDPDHGRFNLFEIKLPGTNRPRRLRCFLGQRYGLRTTDALRMNLRYVLEPSNRGTDLERHGYVGRPVFQQARTGDEEAGFLHFRKSRCA